MSCLISCVWDQSSGHEHGTSENYKMKKFFPQWDSNPRPAPGSGPTWDLSEVGSCVEAWWVHVGEGSKGCFQLIIIIFFWLASSPVLYKRITYIHTSKCNIFSMERSSFLYISIIQIMKRIQLPIPCFMKRHSCPELHDFTPFKTKIFWGRKIFFIL